MVIRQIGSKRREKSNITLTIDIPDGKIFTMYLIIFCVLKDVQCIGRRLWEASACCALNSKPDRLRINKIKRREVKSMLKRDDGGELVGLAIGIGIILFIVYVIVILASIIAGIAAVGGTLFGGGSAIKNYVCSFKENVIDSNRSKTVTA